MPPQWQKAVRKFITFTETTLVFGPDNEDSDTKRDLSLSLDIDPRVLEAGTVDQLKKVIGDAFIETLEQLGQIPKGAKLTKKYLSDSEQQKTTPQSNKEPPVIKRASDERRKAIALKAALLIDGYRGPSGQIFDTVGRVVATPNHQRLLEPCEIYLFRTSLDPYKKFGIAKDSIKRGKAAGKNMQNRYVELLWRCECKTRAQAISIEATFIQDNYNAKIRDEQMEEKLGMTNEITALDTEDFKRLVEKRIKEYSEMSIHDFFTLYRVEAYSSFMLKVDNLLSGDYKILDANKFEMEWYGRPLQMEGVIDGEKWEFNKARLMEPRDCSGPLSPGETRVTDGLIELEEVPEYFEKAYGFPLLQD